MSDRFEDVARAVADGTEPEWPDELDDDPVLTALRDIDTLARAHRALHGTGGEGADGQERADPAPTHEVGDRWGHLEILGWLGRGGYGEVYRARDTVVDREVALKLMRSPAEHDETPTDGVSWRDALVAEARLLAKITHVNVSTVHGADRRDGRVGLWMEMIEGQTLAELVAEQGPLGAEEAVLLGMDLCRALAAVHRKGIVHRDIKAQNVLRERGGRVVLTDFGIGVDVGAGRRGAGPTGTPVYLAPELLEGGEATRRTDIYALGVLLFHLVTGDFPVRAKSLQSLRAAHRDGDARLLRDLRPDLPWSFVEAVETAIAPDPQERWATAGRFQQALARVLSPQVRPATGRFVRAGVALGLVAALALGIVRVALREEPIDLLVADLSTGPTSTSSSLAIEGALAAALRQHRAARVVVADEIATTLRRMRVEGGPPNDGLLLEAARRVGAEAVLEIEVLRSEGDGPDGATPLVELRLVSSADGLVRAQERVAVGVDPLSVDDLAGALSDLVADGGPWPMSGPMPAVTTGSFEALEAYAGALEAFDQQEVDVACDRLRRATEIDPSFASAFRSLGNCRSAQGKASDALDASRTAYELRHLVATDLERLLIEGTYFGSRQQFRRAIETYEQVVRDDPSSAFGHRQIGSFLEELGEYGQAIASLRTAAQLDPNEINYGYLALVLAHAGEREEAARELATATAMDSESEYLLWPAGAIALVEGDTERAVEAFRSMMLESQQTTYRHIGQLYLAQAHIFRGDLETTRAVLRDGLRTDRRVDLTYMASRRLVWLARTAWLQRQTPAAVGYLEQIRALEAVPADLRPLRSAAVLAIELDLLAEAEELLGRLDALAEEYPGAVAEMVTQQVRAEVLAARGDLDGALRTLRGIEDVADVGVLWSLGRIHRLRADDEAAADIYRRLLARKGEVLRNDHGALWVLSHLHLADALDGLGRAEEAEQSRRAYREIWGDFEPPTR